MYHSLPNSDTESAPGSLFGNLPVPDSASEAQGPPAAANAANSSSSAAAGGSEASYVDFYARLGGNEGNDEMTTSLLGPLHDNSSSWFRQNKKIVRLAVGCAATLLCAAVLWWISGGREIDPPTWVPDSAYQVSFVLTLASGLAEPGVAMVDQARQLQRLSYYSGMTTYIFNATGASFSIVPRVDRLTCFVEPAGVPLQSVFPDTRKFRHKGEVLLTPARRGSGKQPRGGGGKVECDEWVYEEQDRASALYYGQYKLYTRVGVDGAPVRFSFVGRNVILGTSHYDNYTIDYFDYQPLGEVDDFWLQPPRGMACVQHEQAPSGPTSAAGMAQSLAELFPHAADRRREAYDAFRAAQGKVGPLDSPERENLFHATQRLVQVHNRAPGQSYTLGLNSMADWTAGERRALAGRFSAPGPRPPSSCRVESLADILASQEQLPGFVDHVSDGLALPPGEQGTCGSCWAFAATGAIEGRTAKKSQKPIVPLSQQNLMDCSWSGPYFNGACGGGLDYMGFAWLMDHNDGRLATLDSYPYLNQDGFCHFDVKRGLVRDGARADLKAPEVVGCFHVTEQWNLSAAAAAATRPEDLARALNLRLASVGPLSVSIDASPHDFYFYKSGVYDNPDCRNGPAQLDHSVLAVGFRTDADKPYTVVRNNWGLAWGEGGYARIAQRNNICGVATAAVYVEVADVTAEPTAQPTPLPTAHPTTAQPTTAQPTTAQPTTAQPTVQPSARPIVPPVSTAAPSEPHTPLPTNQPTPLPSSPQTDAPTPLPSSPKTDSPTLLPTSPPTPLPTPLSTSPPTPLSTPLPTSQPTATTSAPT